MGREPGAGGGQAQRGPGRRSLPEPISVADALGAHDPRRLLEVLVEHDVRFVLIGGLAAAAHGSKRTTNDVDVTPDVSPENLLRLQAAIRDLGAQARVPGSTYGVPEVVLDSATLRQMQMTLVTRHGLLDLAFLPDGTAGYADLAAGASRHVVLGVSVEVASLDDVIRSKTAAGRVKDASALPELRAIHDSKK